MFDTRNIPSFSSHKFATAVGSHVSTCCHSTSIRSFREASAETHLDNCTSPWADSVLRPYEWGCFSHFTEQTFKIIRNFGYQDFWAWYEKPSSLLITITRSKPPPIGLRYSIKRTTVRFLKGGIHSPAEKIHATSLLHPVYCHGIFKLKDQKSWYLRAQLQHLVNCI